MDNGTDQRKNQPTDKQCGELASVAHGKLAEMLTAYCRSVVGGKIQKLLNAGFAKNIERQLAPLFASSDSDTETLRAYWEQIYRDHYGLEADFSQVYVPELPVEGKWRYVFILKGLTMNHAAVIYKKIITAHNSDWDFTKCDDDLDSIVTENSRTSDESYVIYVRDEPEPDKGYLGQSTIAADPDKKIGVTLLERLVHGAVHLIETNQHLDEKGWTGCTGSRVADDGVPCMFCGLGCQGVFVCVSDVRFSEPGSGLRQAVSL